MNGKFMKTTAPRALRALIIGMISLGSAGLLAQEGPPPPPREDGQPPRAQRAGQQRQHKRNADAPKPNFEEMIKTFEEALESMDSSDVDLSKQGEEGSDLNARMKMLLMRFDKNGDGKLDEAERAAAKEELKKSIERFKNLEDKFVARQLAKFDKDGDGKLDKEELKALMRKMREDADKYAQTPPAMPDYGSTPFFMRPPRELFKTLDVNAEELSMEQKYEIHKAFKQIHEYGLEKFGKSADDRLRPEEVQELAKDPKVAEKINALREKIAAMGEKKPE